MVTKCDAPKEPKQSVRSPDSLVHVLGEDSARGYQLLCERTEGCLLIDGQPIHDLVIPGKFSEKNIDALGAHIQQKRPALSTLLRLVFHLSEGERVAREVGMPMSDECEFNDVADGVKDALSVDQDGAVRDDCIWASMEWKWQERNSRSHKNSRVVRRSVASEIVWKFVEDKKKTT